MHVFYTPDIASNLELPEEEAGHCLRAVSYTHLETDVSIVPPPVA